MSILTPQQSAFIESNRMAAMITVGRDGRPRAVRIAYSVIDGQIWSSGTQKRVRTRRLRKDPRCTLFVFDPVYSFLTLQTEVTILDGPDAPQLNLRYFRALQGRPEGPLSWMGQEMDEEQFLQAMVADERLIYRFEVQHASGDIRV